MIRPFGQHGLEAQFFQSHGQVVVIDKLRVAESDRLLAEEPPDARAVLSDLKIKFIPGVEKGQGVRAGFGHKFHAAGVGQCPEAVHHLGRVLLELVQGRAGDGKGHLEILAVTADQLEQQIIHAQVADARSEQQRVAIAVVVLINGILAHIKNGVAAKSVRFVYFVTQAERWHQLPPETLW